MTTHERIKNRRLELGLSADDVAAVLGISRATIYRYESADIEKLPISILEPLSKILQTTPAYLMGWEEDELIKTAVPRDDGLTERVRLFMSLPPDKQDIVLAMMKVLAEKEEQSR